MSDVLGGPVTGGITGGTVGGGTAGGGIAGGGIASGTAGSAATALAGTPYAGYVYAYPHKTAYRPLDPRPALRDMWAAEDRSALFLYLHVPFCEMRCGFCNLFTRTGAPEGLTEAYLAALDRQARVTADAIGPASFGAAAFGGGTPTYLTAGELETLCAVASRFTDLTRTGFAVETSPATATADRLAVLKDRGATRISIGVQSFDDTEAHAAGRPQRRAEVDAALHRIRAAGFAALNIDLMYGISGQTPASWLRSLETALAWAPEELYLYPLYVRPLTGLGRSGPAGDGLGRAGAAGAAARERPDSRPELYRLGREFLLGAGYEQVSMRMFRRAPGSGAAGPVAAGPVTAAAGAGAVGSGSAGTRYCCQEDGMIGLGCGARSYASSLHYSFEYAVEVSHVRRIIDTYTGAADADFAVAPVGFRLDAGERRRRWFLQSLLQAGGADRAAYRARFGTGLEDDFAADLARFREAGWIAAASDRDDRGGSDGSDGSGDGGGSAGDGDGDGDGDGSSAAADDAGGGGDGTVRLTAEGLAWSDAIGPALFSPRVRALMDGYQAR